jgi:putative ABC transport system substrate-binding protein
MDTSRRLLLNGALAALACSTLRAQQVQRLPRIGLLSNSIPLRDLLDRVPSHPGPGLIEEGLRERGWVDGRNITLVWRSAEGSFDRLPALAAELVALPSDIILAFGGGVTAAARATRTIPIVGLFGNMDDVSPRSAQPNVTGVTLEVGPGFNAKRLSLLKELLPSISRVAFLVTKAWIASEAATVEAARALGIAPFDVEVSASPRAERLPKAFDEARARGAHAMIATDFAHMHWPDFQKALTREAERHRIPVLNCVLRAADNGALLAYGSDINPLYRRMGYFVDRILRGTKPSALPVEQPSRFELVVNLEAARAIGLKVPPSLLSQADRVIR